MRLNEKIELEIDDCDNFGLGIGHIDNFPIFVPNALPGEVVAVKIEKITKNLAKAINRRVLKESENRETNICPYYKLCGGCNIMHMKYDYQLEYKTKEVKKTLSKVAHLNPKVHDCVRNPNIYGYRNKIQVPIRKIDDKIVSGFYEEKSHNIVPMDKCMIEPEMSSLLINDFKLLINKYNLSVYSEDTNKGLIRHIMLRLNKNKEIMLVIVSSGNFPEAKTIIEELGEKYNIISGYLNINPDKTNVVLGREFIHLYKDEYLIEEINSLKFYVSPNSFLQVNHDQCENLYNKAIEYASISSSDVVIDAYCGIGSISLNMAQRAKHVYGIEVIPEAVMNANLNKKLNNIDNATFICGKCEDEIEKLVNKEKVDVIVFDPPRKGCDIKFLNTVIKMDIKRIVYISCKTSTFARDVKYLTDNGYELLEITPFDLFSHQTHTECVGVLIKK